MLGALFLAYQPALRGAFLWDDNAHVPKSNLRTLSGLRQIVAQPGVSQQYYPLSSGLFWFEARLWGDSTFGYHIVNVALHGTGALLLWMILRRLLVPGAALAAAVFALHPVYVESVAWISELKNTSSGVLYLGAALAFLAFDREPVGRRRAGVWTAAFLLFVGAMLAKSVTGSLPAALLVVAWWRRGRIAWRRDVLPLLPHFAFAAAFGWYSARFEANVVGANGVGFDLGFVSRCLIAGRAFWFYLGKLVWPAPLIFIYPRWHIDPSTWWQWMFPAAALALLAALTATHGRFGRGPLAAALFFAGTLFPASGFVNVYPFRFSYVADHFQYLASLGPLVLAAAALTRLLRPAPRPAAVGLAAMLLATLTLLTWRQAHVYRDLEALWSATVEQNPDSFLAQIALGVVYEDQGRHREAIAAEERAVAIDPQSAEARLNLGRSYDALGEYARAAALYEDGMRLESGYAPAVRPRLARLYARLGQFDRALAMAKTAVAHAPTSAYAHAVLGLAYDGLGQRADAEQEWQTALRLDPNGPGGQLAREQLAPPGT